MIEWCSMFDNGCVHDAISLEFAHAVKHGYWLRIANFICGYKPFNKYSKMIKTISKMIKSHSKIVIAIQKITQPSLNSKMIKATSQIQAVKQSVPRYQPVSPTNQLLSNQYELIGCFIDCKHKNCPRRWTTRTVCSHKAKSCEKSHEPHPFTIDHALTITLA